MVAVFEAIKINSEKKVEKTNRAQEEKPNTRGDSIVLHVTCERKVLCHNFNLTPKSNRTRNKQAHAKKPATTFHTIECYIESISGRVEQRAPTQNRQKKSSCVRVNSATVCYGVLLLNDITFAKRKDQCENKKMTIIATTAYRAVT